MDGVSLKVASREDMQTIWKRKDGVNHIFPLDFFGRIL